MEDQANRTVRLRLKRIQVYWLSLAALLVSCPTTCRADGNLAREEMPISWQEDADLTDVFFLNENLGWAVGGQGIVLKTVNGGKDWTGISRANQPFAKQIPLDQKIRNLRNGVRTNWTGVADGRSNRTKRIRCRLETIHFVDELNGWIGGGYSVPYVDRSRAVVLRTGDGGITWREVKGLVIPRIHRIHFANRSNGWAIGETGNLFRTGIYYTVDGGETWSSQSLGRMPDWIDGDQIAGTFVNLDANGQPGIVKQNRYEASVVLGETNGRLARIKMLDANKGWAVGDAGSILQTANGGLSWSSAVSEEERQQLRHFDLKTCSLSQNRLWVAGNPGSIVFSIDLTDGLIEAHPTGVQLPIQDIEFTDDRKGWAVGALGMILSTIDGGKSWQVQRGQHRGVALLGVASVASEMPLEIFASLAGEENRICGVSVLNAAGTDEVWQAVERLGCATGVLSSQDSKSTYEDHLQDLVRTIRMLRPRVIVCNSRFVGTAEQNAIVADPESFVLAAIQAAADQNGFPDQLRRADLETWQVDRLAVLDPTGTITVDPRRMLPRTGSLVEDRVAISRALLGLPLAATEKPVYRVQHFSVTSKRNESDLFAGLANMGRPLPTRATADGFRGNLSAIQLANSKHKKFQQFEKIDVKTPHDFSVWHQQVLGWTLSLQQDMAGIWLTQLAERYLELGRPELSAATLAILANRISEHGLSPAALTWLIQYYASDEMSQIALQARLNGEWKSSNQSAESRANQYESRPASVRVNGVSHLVWNPVSKAKPAKRSTGNNESTHVTMSDPDNGDDDSQSSLAMDIDQAAFFESRWRLAGQFLGRLGMRDPDLVVGGQYRLLESQINRKLKGISQTAGPLKQLAQQEDLDVAGICLGAQRELALEGLIPEPLNQTHEYRCLAVDQPPRLDGKLTDDIWQQALENGFVTRFETANSKDLRRYQEPDLAMFAFDDEFLYVAFRCIKLKGQNYQTSRQPRPRDPDLSRRDRVEFWFDVDRDYRSASHFSVDYRGWATDCCGGARGWNPEWFVSRADDDQSWTVELAIPLEQLVPTPIAPETVWGLRLARRTYSGDELWGRGSQQLTSVVEGLQVGFLSQPAQYELIRFK